jgi:hypothetical protein
MFLTLSIYYATPLDSTPYHVTPKQPAQLALRGLTFYNFLFSVQISCLSGNEK